ncbi:sigma factor-like helix-turn-helix DNA-binding protein [Oceanobacillus timonensis]|uniref:sigma factor-like helix-turn-helix DNA-binding protein n=1 Tax=Oceanobacillus timonensis TaxID=1926285 RepID=UPI0009B9B610|nr:sigma factor-like helix-turn-helix DNA-binding protein [Oceanobacillus timonensis]
MCARPGINRNEEDISFHTMYRRLSYYCFFLSPNKWDGEELVQETVKKALISYGNPDSWNVTLLKKIAYHVWIDKNRSKLNESEHFLEEKLEPKSNYEEIEALVMRLLSFMTVKQLLVFLMKDVFAYRINEIAENCEMSETAVKAMLNRARKHIQNINEEEVSEAAGDNLSENTEERFVQVVVHAIKANDPFIPAIFMTNYPILLLRYQTHRPSSYAFSMAA